SEPRPTRGQEPRCHSIVCARIGRPRAPGRVPHPMKHPNSPGVRAPRLLAAVLAVTFLMTQGSLAAPTDAEANKQIDSAINTQYASAQIAAAEKTLLDLIQACGNQCAPSTVARAWMYVGIVRGSGKDDLAGAQKAFAEAKR